MSSFIISNRYQHCRFFFLLLLFRIELYNTSLPGSRRDIQRLLDYVRDLLCTRCREVLLETLMLPLPHISSCPSRSILLRTLCWASGFISRQALEDLSGNCHCLSWCLVRLIACTVGTAWIGFYACATLSSQLFNNITVYKLWLSILLSDLTIAKLFSIDFKWLFFLLLLWRSLWIR